MALKFLNKKGWHTGSLRNIENVWKAEQKNDAEQKKLEELRKQINEERERSEFRQLQEAAGLVPRQERLDFLYESGLAVGKGNSDGFKALEAQPSGGASSTAAESSSSKTAVPGALFEDKPQSANDTWRKLHSDPLLLIRQREQEALARIKNNPIRMAMLRKSLESEDKQQEVKKEHKKKRKKQKHNQSKSKDKYLSKSQSDSEFSGDHEVHRRQRNRSSNHTSIEDKEDRRNVEKGDRRKMINHTTERHDQSKSKDKYLSKSQSDSEFSGDHEGHRRRRGRSSEPQNHTNIKDKEDRRNVEKADRRKMINHTTERHENSHSKYSGKDLKSDRHKRSEHDDLHSGDKHAVQSEPERRNSDRTTSNNYKHSSNLYNNRRGVTKMTEEEREARLREMQMDAEVHEEQRWKRLKKAAEADALEAKQATYSRGKSFLDATQKSVYGMAEGSSATIEESVRRRTYYSQAHSAHESNAFRR